MKLLTVFRITAFLEGLSYILLLGVGVPLKYFQNNDAIVKAIGMPHGLLFIFYVFASYVIKQKLNWSIKTYAIIISAAVIPFGTFYTDLKYLRK